MPGITACRDPFRGKIVVGDILWLGLQPPKIKPLPWPILPQSVFNHAVLLISPQRPSQDKVTVLILSDPQDRNLLMANPPFYIPHEGKPFNPAPPQADTSRLLYLQDDLEMEKNTCVQTQNRFLVPRNLLTTLPGQTDYGRRYRLRNDSLAKVLSIVDLSNPTVEIVVIEYRTSGPLHTFTPQFLNGAHYLSARQSPSNTYNHASRTAAPGFWSLTAEEEEARYERIMRGEERAVSYYIDGLGGVELPQRPKKPSLPIFRMLILFSLSYIGYHYRKRIWGLAVMQDMVKRVCSCVDGIAGMMPVWMQKCIVELYEKLGESVEFAKFGYAALPKEIWW